MTHRLSLLLPIVGLLCVSPSLAQEEVAPEPETAAPAQTVTYTLDSSRSWLYVMIYNDPNRWTPVNGHDHGVRATTFDGVVRWNADDPSQCKVDIVVPLSGLAIDPPGMRERAGLSADGAIGEGAKRTATGNMLGRSQLDQSSFPKITYTATSCSGTTGTVNVTGSLSIRGVAKSFTLPMQITVSESSFSARGEIGLTHADFGMKPFTYGPGTPKNLDKLLFVVDVVGSAN